MKVRTVEELSRAMTDSVSWRKHELKNLVSFFKDTKKPLVPLVKGALLLTYAHWEGGVKDLALCYLNFVEQQKCKRKDLRPNFIALASMSTIKKAGASNSLYLYQQAVEYIIHSGEHTYKLPNIQLVNTEDNLSSTVLYNLLFCMGLSESRPYFESKERTIDTALLKVRNELAHTGRSEREDIGLNQLLEDILELLDSLKTDLENAAVSQKYKI